MAYDLIMLSAEKGPVSLEELHAFRIEDGTSFPASYIRFAEQYGFGVTCGQFLIYMPMGNHCDSISKRSRAIRSTYEDVLGNPNNVWFPLEPDMHFEKLKRLIPFAGSENGYYLFWDTQRSAPDEMDIYITDFRGLGFIRAAGNLYELIEKMTSLERFKEVFPLFRSEELPATFRSLR